MSTQNEKLTEKIEVAFIQRFGESAKLQSASDIVRECLASAAVKLIRITKGNVADADIEGEFYTAYRLAAAAEALESLARQSSAAVGVRGLEWVRVPGSPDLSCAYELHATTEIGLYRVRVMKDGGATWGVDANLRRLWVSPEEAQALAQSDFNARVATLVKVGPSLSPCITDMPGFGWQLLMSDDREELHLSLRSPQGDPAATVFLTLDIDRFNWFVWDRDGVGGENDGESTVLASMREAELATKRWGRHSAPPVPSAAAEVSDA